VLFKEESGFESEAQIAAFDDTWHWDKSAQEIYYEITNKCSEKVVKTITGLFNVLGANDMMAYLVMMTIRLVELHRVLKKTGSIYLHCDPTASHYLKIVLDAVFGFRNFKNDISWCFAEREVSNRQYNCKHNCILFYVKDDESNYTFNYEKAATRYSTGTIEKFNYTDEKGRPFQIRGKGGDVVGEQGLPLELEKTHPDWVYRDYLDKSTGVLPRDWLAPPMGNSVCPFCKKESKDNILYLAEQRSPSRYPFAPLNRAAKERLGYPTQKPESLLELLISVSSNKGDVVLDPFCGCGTTVVAAEKLNRKWIGIDITHLATGLIKKRLNEVFGGKVKYKEEGFPKDLSSAKALADQDRFQFQCWALSLVKTIPRGSDDKKGADKGIDGCIFFHDTNNPSDIKKIIIQVKSGEHISSAQVRDLKGTIDREKAVIGVFITLEEPTRDMKKESASTEFYKSPLGSKHPKIQILKIEELLGGKEIDYPRSAVDVTLKRAPKVKDNSEKQTEMF
jgi:site-specific DNA-methyltransferase (adenine-specific)